jgi:hypothetical protein
MDARAAANLGVQPARERTATGLVQASTQRTVRCFDFTKSLQMSGLHGHIRAYRTTRTRIVALEEVAGSIPVGHPSEKGEFAAYLWWQGKHSLTRRGFLTTI